MNVYRCREDPISISRWRKRRIETGIKIVIIILPGAGVVINSISMVGCSWFLGGRLALYVWISSEWSSLRIKRFKTLLHIQGKSLYFNIVLRK